ncbi:MAG: hypothetical protein JW832_06465 [Deltaproteobacteria bacterium]|nr:hypothetical protein [Deltaproteobacteria bacterium]
MKFFYFIKTDHLKNKSHRIRLIREIVSTADVGGGVSDFDGNAVGLIETIQDSSEELFLFIHNGDFGVKELISYLRGAENWPKHCYAIFFSAAAGTIDENVMIEQIKCLKADFPTEVTQDSFYFTGLVSAVKAAAAGNSEAFAAIDINNPPTAKLLETWMAFDVLIQGASLLLQKGKLVPGDWFGEIRGYLERNGEWEPCDPGKQNLKVEFNKTMFENLRLTIIGKNVDKKNNYADYMTTDSLANAHEDFVKYSEVICSG